jgi:hypothetical protein
MSEVVRITITPDPVRSGFSEVRADVTDWDQIPDDFGFAELWDTFEWFAQVGRQYGAADSACTAESVGPIPDVVVPHLIARLGRTLTAGGLHKLITPGDGPTDVIRVQDWRNNQ